MKNLKRISAIIGVLLVLSFVLSACGSNGVVYDYSSKKSVGSNDTVPKEQGIDLNASEGNEKVVASERKIIKNVEISAETKNFDSATTFIKQKVNELGGYIENSKISGLSLYGDSHIQSRHAAYTIRIPVEKLDAYVSDIENSEINIVSSGDYIDDVTDHYYDLEARLNSLKEEEKRLLEMLAESKDLNYLIQLNERLSKVRYEIESYTSSINRYDNKIAYSTVKLSLSEVIDYTVIDNTPSNFGERFSLAFKESWADFAEWAKDFAIGFVYAFPTILVIAVIIIVIIFIIKASVKKKKKHPVSPIIHNPPQNSEKK